MSSTVVTPIAAAIAAIADAITGVTAYSSDPGMAGLEGNPACVVGVPTIDRGDLDSDPQLGSRGWMLVYPVNLYFDLDVPQDTQTLAVDTVEAFIKAVDADDQLGATVIAARVTSAEPVVLVGDQTRPRLVYECSVTVEAYVA